jgi:hypothetical protein
MSKQVEMIRELSADELDVVSGGKGKEHHHSKYDVIDVVDWGPFAFGRAANGDWGMTFWSNSNVGYGVSFTSVDGIVKVHNH